MSVSYRKICSLRLYEAIELKSIRKEAILGIMNIALLTGDLLPQEIKRLAKEFPEYLFLFAPRYPIDSISMQDWERTEILFGDKLSREELMQAPQLRWIHTPSSNLNRLCLKDIEKNGNVIITTTRNEQLFQIGEFVISTILAFAKNLFQWKDANRFPHMMWDCKLRNLMETLHQKTLLQVGMGGVGREIAKRAKNADMKVWGMDIPGSYHPYCARNFSIDQLVEVLPLADVISVAIPRNTPTPFRLSQEELALIKDGAIISIVGSSKLVDEEALMHHAPRFRGISIDAFYQSPIPAKSKLWLIPNLLITPEISPRPKLIEREAMHTFRFNLRQYRHDNYADMKNLVDPQVIPEQEFA
jgi:D-2-hydroxyacid dehydrogenase (NADP+)